jgi:hypothetical protein
VKVTTRENELHKESKDATCLSYNNTCANIFSEFAAIVHDISNRGCCDVIDDSLVGSMLGRFKPWFAFQVSMVQNNSKGTPESTHALAPYPLVDGITYCAISAQCAAVAIVAVPSQM